MSVRVIEDKIHGLYLMYIFIKFSRKRAHLNNGNSPSDQANSTDLMTIRQRASVVLAVATAAQSNLKSVKVNGGNMP